MNVPKGSTLYGKFKESGVSVKSYVIWHEGHSAWLITMKKRGRKRDKIVPLSIEPRWGYDAGDVANLEKETDTMLKEFAR